MARPRRTRFSVGVVVASVLAGTAFVASATAVSDGTLDASFGASGIAVPDVGQSVMSVTVQSDGKTVATTTGPDNYSVGVVRLTAAGTPDATFGDAGVVTFDVVDGVQERPIAVAVDSAGRIIVAGYLSQSNADSFVVRLTSTGQLDATFDGPSGTGNGIILVDLGSTDKIRDMTVDSSNRIVVLGDTSDAEVRMFVMRYTATGILDSSFDSDGIAFAGFTGATYAGGVAVAPNGDVVGGGWTFVDHGASGRNYDAAVARWTSTGAPVANGPTAWVDAYGWDQVLDAAVQSDGKVVLVGTSGGNGTITDANTKMLVVRFTASGNLDTTFNPLGATPGVLLQDISANGATGFNDVADKVAIQFDDKIVVAAEVKTASYWSATNTAVVRFTSSGALDTTFNPTGATPGIAMPGFDPSNADYPMGLAIGPDNRVTVASLGGFYLGRFVVSANISSLSGLSVQGATLVPSFAPSTSGYVVAVANSVRSVRITPTATERNASVKVNGVSATSGAASAAVALKPGNNYVTVLVTSQDATTQNTYTVRVVRGIGVLRRATPITAAAAMATVDKTIPSRATVRVVVSSRTRSKCSYSTTTRRIRGLAAGTCTVTITVTPRGARSPLAPVVVNLTVV